MTISVSQNALKKTLVLRIKYKNNLATNNAQTNMILRVEKNSHFFIYTAKNFDHNFFMWL